MTKYHAFVRVSDFAGHEGHVAHVPYDMLDAAMSHITGWQDEGCEWAAVLDDEGNTYFISTLAEDHRDDLIRRIERY